MLISRFGLSNIPMPFYSPDDMGGGGGDIGGDAGGGGNTALDSPAEPSVIDIDDNALIRIKGSDKPVKFGEHVKGFQSQWTKAAQKAAQLEQKLQQESQLRQRYEQEARAAAQRQQQSGGGQEDVFASLRSLPYLSGEDAVRVVQDISNQIQQRDQIMLALAKKFQQIQGQVGSLSQSSNQAQFENKISKFLTDGGYDPEHYGEFARELYVAYEGDDLDTEFPGILRSRIEQLEKAFAAKRAATVAAARKQPFVPGRGGVTGPSKPLEIKPNASPKEVADQLWSSFQSGSDT